MDQHPIPQDVTGFQFKLIGAMTVKQFGYVATGVIMAVVLYYLPLHSAFGILTKVLFIPLFGVSGVIVSFVPLDGRPIDLMVTNFVKALFSPNQYIYHRRGRQLAFTTVTVANSPAPTIAQQKAQRQQVAASKRLDQKEEKLRELLLSTHASANNTMDKREAAFLDKLTMPAANPLAATIGAPVPAPVEPPIRTTIVEKTVPSTTPEPPIQPIRPIQPMPQQQMIPIDKLSPEELTKKEQELEQALSEAKQEDQSPTTHASAQQKIALLTKQIDEIHAQKQKLEQELTQLHKQLVSQKNASTTTTKVSTQTTKDPQHVRTIPQGVTKTVGLPHVSDSPNVVVGIVKDPRGNILPNILVEVKDKDGNPVRAFKTNQLGQFASATPLSPGTYTLELEDPKKQNRFDVIQITANNQILLPIEVISHDAREELRKQLFSN